MLKICEIESLSHIFKEIENKIYSKWLISTSNSSFFGGG